MPIEHKEFRKDCIEMAFTTAGIDIDVIDHYFLAKGELTEAFASLSYRQLRMYACAKNARVGQADLPRMIELFAETERDVYDYKSQMAAEAERKEMEKQKAVALKAEQLKEQRPEPEPKKSWWGWGNGR